MGVISRQAVENVVVLVARARWRLARESAVERSRWRAVVRSLSWVCRAEMDCEA